MRSNAAAAWTPHSRTQLLQNKDKFKRTIALDSNIRLGHTRQLRPRSCLPREGQTGPAVPADQRL